MAKLTNVQLRGNVYHFRMNVPADLQEHYRRTAHTQSLETESSLEAERKADALTAKYKKEHQAVRLAIKNPSAGIPSPKKPASKAFDLSSIEYQMNQLSGGLDGMENDQLNTLYHRIGGVRHSLT